MSQQINGCWSRSSMHSGTRLHKQIALDAQLHVGLEEAGVHRHLWAIGMQQSSHTGQATAVSSRTTA